MHEYVQVCTCAHANICEYVCLLAEQSGAIIAHSHTMKSLF